VVEVNAVNSEEELAATEVLERGLCILAHNRATAMAHNASELDDFDSLFGGISLNINFIYPIVITAHHKVVVVVCSHHFNSISSHFMYLISFFHYNYYTTT
jgi:hypothetical protein